MNLILISLVFSLKAMTLSDYIEEVKQKNHDYKAEESKKTAEVLKSQEFKTMTGPLLNIELQDVRDEKETINPSAQGSRTDYRLLSTKVSQALDYGFKLSADLNISHTKISGANPMFLSKPEFNDTAWGIEFSKSLLRGAHSEEKSLTESIVAKSHLAEEKLSNFKQLAKLAEAEMVYIALSQLIKIKNIQKEILERAEKLKSWAKNRADTGLGDRSDLLQSDANLKFRQIELTNLEQEIRKTKHQFNLLRETDGDLVAEESLQPILDKELLEIKLPTKKIHRLDTEAFVIFQEVKSYDAQMNIEKNKPTLDLFGRYVLNNKASDTINSFTHSVTNDHATRIIGLKFTMPLNMSVLNDNKLGYTKNLEVNQIQIEKKKIDEESEWNDLTARFVENQNKLKLLDEMISAQENKVKYETERLKKGRTVTFQVLNFEQDLAQAKLLKVQTQTQILSIFSQLKLF